MADRLNLPAARLPACLAMAVAMGSIGPAWGQGMNDPTRPPEGLAAGDYHDAAAGGGPVLQSVLISPAGSYAIISGQVVRVGQKFGDAVLVKVAESEVVLRGDGGTQVLKLHPGIDKQASAPRRDKAPRARAGTAPPRQGQK